MLSIPVVILRSSDEVLWLFLCNRIYPQATLVFLASSCMQELDSQSFKNNSNCTYHCIDIKNSAFYLHSVFMYFINYHNKQQVSSWTALTSWSLLPRCSVFCEVGIEFLNIILRGKETDAVPSPIVSSGCSIQHCHNKSSINFCTLMEAFTTTGCVQITCLF